MRKAPHIRTRPLVDPLPFGPGFQAHKMVMDLAIAMAQEHYGRYALDNAWNHKMRAGGKITEKQSRLVFCRHVAPQLLEDARQVLAGMLGQPEDVVPQAMKDEIYEALLLDNDMRGKRPLAASQATMPKGVMVH